MGRKVKLLLGLTIAASLIALPALAETEKETPRVITTSGEAKIWIQPDRARVYLGIETMRETIESARQENAENIKKVMEALKSLNIKGMLIKAPSYNVSLVKEDTHDATRQGRLPKIIGYKVVQDFTVLLQNDDPVVLAKDAALVVDTALNTGVNIIQSIEFFKENDTADKRQVMSKAVEDAIANAKAIAAAAGLTIKAYTAINSQTAYLQPPHSRNAQMAPMVDMGGGVGAEATTLIAGTIAVTSRASLSCTVE